VPPGGGPTPGASLPLPAEAPMERDPATPAPGAHGGPTPGEPPAEAPGGGPTAPDEGEPRPAEPSRVAGSPILGGGPVPQLPAARQGTPRPGETEQSPQSSGGISVRTLGQGVPFARRLTEQGGGSGQSAGGAGGAIPSTPSTPTPPPGSGRRRKLATPPAEAEERTGGAQGAGAAPHAGPGSPPAPGPQPHAPQGPPTGGHGRTPAREFAIGAPDAGAAEGPEPLDGPNGAVEVTEGAGLTMPLRPVPVDDELPPEPLDNPRRLLVWPEPDVSTQQALSDRGYRPVIVHSREEVDAQIAAYPAALFVDPLTGPITRTALQSLRQAAVAAEVPVLVTAGLGQATREAAYGADPAVLLKALAPRDSEQHPPRVLLVEEQEAIAGAFAATLERRGMQVAHAPTDSDAVNVAAQVRPNLVVMDLMQVRRRRAGIIDWLRVNGLLNRTPFVVYTSAGMDPGALQRLASGETVLFLAERSTNAEVQGRIVDLLAKIGAT
ncbi:response regulator, partial [Streptomyces sp. JJ36]|uniref:response regulator n=1 Tax=Streptomyces sp. JJ36 TaxID=2736645 RepID=UPI001F258586